MAPIRLLLVDDVPLVRVGLRTILHQKTGIDIVGEAENGEQAVMLCRKIRPDVVLMDIRMPGMDGIRAAALISGPGGIAGVKVVMLTMFDHDEYLFRALKLGAAGFVVKDSAPDVIVAAVRLASSGEALLSPKTTARLISAFVHAPDAPREPSLALANLTPRERDVLELIVSGLNNSEIGLRLTVSLSTVKSHLRHLYEKLQCRDRVQLVIYGFEHGLGRHVHVRS